MDVSSPFIPRAVKFFSEQRQFRFRVFRARDSVPCLSASPRETEYSLAEALRQGRGVLLFLSCRNYPRETVSGRLRQPGIRDESCKYRKPDSPALHTVRSEVPRGQASLFAGLRVPSLIMSYQSQQKNYHSQKEKTASVCSGQWIHMVDYLMGLVSDPVGADLCVCPCHA
ncbi:MAG: hypothetical protein B6245_20045 [Desulfobacteraceae bacterium 4572_88]|nr:MAG: hypothetical protein B6245_20045 [Desulfobacteraceae bacterium 4572_88]